MKFIERSSRVVAILIAIMVIFSGVLTASAASSVHPVVTGSSQLHEEGDIGSPAVNVCDFNILTGAFGPGSVAEMLTSAETMDQDVNCFRIQPPVSMCGRLDIDFISVVTGFQSDYKLLWVEGNKMPADAKGASLPAVFPEDYNGGSVTITVFLVGPEKDYVDFAGDDVQAYSFWHSENGVQFEINTNCEQPEVTVVTPEPFTFVDADCDVAPSIKLPETANGINYFIEGAVVPGGTVTVWAEINLETHAWGDLSGTAWKVDQTYSPWLASQKVTISNPTNCATETPTETITPTETVTPTETTTPTATVKPTEKPATPTPTPVEIKELPGTGAGATDANHAMIWLTAGSALTLMAVGLLRRKEN